MIVGVTVDELVQYKGKKAVIPFEERIEIIRSIKYVDMAVPQINMDKISAQKRYNFDIMFVGSDWKGTEKWNKIEADMKNKCKSYLFSIHQRNK